MNEAQKIEEAIENKINSFIKKWCNHYSHLLDTDDNDGQELRVFIHSQMLALLAEKEMEIEELKAELSRIRAVGVEEIANIIFNNILGWDTNFDLYINSRGPETQGEFFRKALAGYFANLIHALYNPVDKPGEGK